MSIPTRPFLDSNVSIVGLGCSSFSSFFWSETEREQLSHKLTREHPRVEEWIRVIRYAVETASINLLDTAPWYGHGSSETVVGWALQELKESGFDRSKLLVNTKIGRYEADPRLQFDYSAARTLASVKRSLERLQIDYIDVLQLHDPEFAPDLEQLLQETIPAMLECQRKGWCRRLGLTGYPLKVQHQILERAREVFGKNIFDQSLTYSHYNLHDRSLIELPVASTSFADYCDRHGLGLLAAAPLSMGLLTQRGPPDWHPASPALKNACRAATELCLRYGVDIADLALLVALAQSRVPCTILGMKSVEEVKSAQRIACRLADIAVDSSSVLDQVMTADEKKCWETIQDSSCGPFASVVHSGEFQWDGVGEARKFWEQVPVAKAKAWQAI